MRFVITGGQKLCGEIAPPASKSHTIRALFIAACADGTSTLLRPLFSEDTRAAIDACRALGADITQYDDRITVSGFGSRPHKPEKILDMLNSGTSTNLLIGLLAALGIEAQITGDASLRTRPVSALCTSLRKAGCAITFAEQEGKPPLHISGRISRSDLDVDGSQSSQYVSSLLLACPLLDFDTRICVRSPSELPYIEMTLAWLDRQGIRYERDGFSRFTIRGGQSYTPFEQTIPADWSSAAFPACAAAVTGSEVFLKGLDCNDVQGDKAILDYLSAMGTDIVSEPEGVRVLGKRILRGAELDINTTPDALPALAVTGCCARGETRLCNVAQARVKETDRIQVMAQELAKMKARVRELPDGLLISHSDLQGVPVHGHNDHRVVMALCVAGLAASGVTTIDTAESVSVTYPHFAESMNAIGAHITVIKEDDKRC